MQLKQQTKRRLLYGSNTLVVSLVIVLIFAALNFLASRYSYRVDLTSNNSFSLSDQTIKVLGGLKSDVTITGFFNDQFSNYEEGKFVEFTKDLLGEYKAKSGKIKIEYVNPSKEPQQAKNAGIRGVPAVVIAINGLSDILYGQKADEQNITASIVKLSREKTYKIGFVGSKGGNELDSTLTLLDGALKGEGYDVAKVDFITEKDFSSFSAIIVPGAIEFFTDNEMYLLDKYIYEGGKVLFALDPLTYTGLEDLSEFYGVKFDDDIVIDEQSYMVDFFRGPFYHWPIITDFPEFQVTKNFTSVMLPLSRSIATTLKKSDTLSIDEFMKTTVNSWAETDTKNTSPKYDEGVDKKGPFTMGIAMKGKFSSFYEGKTIDPNAVSKSDELEVKVEDKTIEQNKSLEKRGDNKEARLIFVGDSDFMTDQHIRSNNNGDLIMNSINWLIEDEALISIRAKEADMRQIDPLSATAQNVVFWLNILGVPFLVLIFGLTRYLLIQKYRKM